MLTLSNGATRALCTSAAGDLLDAVVPARRRRHLRQAGRGPRRRRVLRADPVADRADASAGACPVAGALRWPGRGGPEGVGRGRRTLVGRVRTDGVALAEDTRRRPVSPVLE